MKMGRYLLTALAITGLIGLASCNDADDDKGGSNTIPGNWILLYDHSEGTIDGETFTWSQTWPTEIFSALMLQFTETTVQAYYNFRCSDEWGADIEEGSPYNLEDGNKITITWIQWDGETRIETYDYAFSGSELTLTRNWTDGADSEIYIMRLERYTGIFPPSEWTTAVANDTYEPDDNVASATSLTVGGTEQDHTLPINDTDWYTFSAQSGTSYIIAISGFLGPELYLYNADGDSMLANYEHSFYENAGHSWTCTETGLYSVEVRNDSAEDCGEYGISIATGSSTAKARELRKEKKTIRYRPFKGLVYTSVGAPTLHSH